MKFSELDLKPEILRALTDMEYQNLTPIQEEAFSPILKGKDLLARAETGSGKTAVAERPGAAALEVGGQDRHSGIGAQVGEGRDIAVDRRHWMTQTEEQSGVPAAAGRQVEHRSAGRNPVGKPPHPGRGFARTLTHRLIPVTQR